MADITMAKANIDQNEVKYGAAMSEATFTKIGGSINHINGTQFKAHSWNLNGNLASSTTTEILDGLFVFPYDAQLVALTMSMSVIPTGDAATVDIFRVTSSGSTATSIFSTRPSFTSSVTQEVSTKPHPVFLGISLVETGGGISSELDPASGSFSGASDKPAAGATLPIFASAQIQPNQFDAYYLKMNAAASGQDLNVTIYFRPR